MSDPRIYASPVSPGGLQQEKEKERDQEQEEKKLSETASSFEKTCPVCVAQREKKEEREEGVGEEDGRGLSRLSMLYNVILTPINFISFLFSLSLIDAQYNNIRRRQHHSHSSSHWWEYKKYYNSYYTTTTPTDPYNQGQQHWHYGTKQRELFKKEAEEALGMRNIMVFVMGVCALGCVGGGLWVVWWAWRYLRW